MKNFLDTMKRCKDEIYNRRNRQSADAFVKVQAFVESGVYSSCKRAGEIARLTLRGYDPLMLAEHFDRSYETMRTEKRSISVRLWEIFPHDFFDKLLDYKENKQYIEECLYSIATYDVSASNLLLLDVARDIEYAEGSSACGQYSIEDLKDEIEFLARYSRPFYENDKRGVDSSKLKYLVAVLNSSTGDFSIRAKILKELIGDVEL